VPAAAGEFPGASPAPHPDQEINVPKSRVRDKKVYTPPPRSSKSKVSPPWLVPTMIGCLVVGFIIAGLGLATKWR